MQLLFPSDPFHSSAVDEVYAEELAAACAAGTGCSVFSLEDFEAGLFRPRPELRPGEQTLYRGWMLTPDRYARLHAAIVAKGGIPVTSPAQYRLCHYLPEWYAICEDLTPETVIVSRDADFVAALAGRDWPAYFVKDYVKSLNAQRGSVAATPQEVSGIVSLIEHYRGVVEGGVCIRRFESLIAESEERYFVLRGRAYGREGGVPALVQEIARRVESPFFSVDVIQAQHRGLRLIELGDGQVSDRKKWPLPGFIAMLGAG